ncbi:hypothetical protein [Phocaeicola coprophilus]
MITEKLLTPDILQTIIICCTIIIIATIGVSAYRVYQKQLRSWGSYIYYASILTLIGIIVFSNAFYGNRNVLDFISLASALISIILAVVTILYSFYSNSQSTGQVEILNNAAKSVEEATLSYSESAESLQENISKIIAAVNRVEEKTDRIIDMAFGSASGTNNHLINFDLEAYIKEYVDLASPVGVVAMYACINSKDANKNWNLDLFISENNQFYCSGFLISTTSAGFITLNIDFSNGNVSVSKYVDIIKKYIFSKISTSVFAEDLQNVKNNIDRYFENAQ